jgi:CRP/FNR family transcriptional regulator
MKTHRDDCRGECSWIFAGLDVGGIAEIRAMSRPITYEKGEIIFQEGEPAFGFYIICSGKVKLAKHSLGGKRQILKLLGPGEMLGEKTMFDREVYTAYAKTLEKTKVNFLEREAFIDFLRRYPSVSFKIIEKLSRELKGFQSKLIETSYEGSAERLARLLLLMSEDYGMEEDGGLYIGVDLSRTELAEMAGISPETAIRTLSRMKERGIIALKGHKIYILDKESLSEIAEPFQVALRENLL